MPDQDRRLRVSLTLPDGGPPALRAGAARLAAWLVRDPRMDLAGIAHAPAATATGLAAALQRLEAPLAGRLAVPEMPDTEMPDTGMPDTVLSVPADTPPDVVVDLTGRSAAEIAAGSPAPGAGGAPRSGTWRLSAHRPGAGLAEAMTGTGLTEVALLDEAARVIGRARYSTKPIAARNAAFVAEKAVQLAMRALAELHLTGAVPRQEGAAWAEPAAPGLGTALGYVPRLGRALAQRAGTAAARKLGLRPGPFHLRLCPGGPLDFDPRRGRTLSPPPGLAWADPFVFVHRGVPHVFYEEYGPSGLGVLKVARLEDGRLEELGQPITADHHLSFPFVFEAGGEIWMMPETIAAGRLETWRAVDFPLRWERAGRALEGAAPGDCALVRHGDQWWLFANLCADSFGDYSTELHLYRVDGPLLREVVPHPLNPVVIDSSTARGGGRVWSEGGRLYRASQNNSYSAYGWGLNVMEIDRLDAEGYAERRVRHFTPDFAPGVIGCHHLDFFGDQVLIDVRYRFGRSARRERRTGAAPDAGRPGP